MYTALILCGGESTRSQLNFNKVFYEIKGKAVVQHAYERFRNDPDCQEVIFVTRREDIPKIKELFGQSCRVLAGGKRRQDSAFIGLKEVKTPYVFIHDGSRPYFSETSLARLKTGLKNHDSVSLGMPIVETVKRVDQGVIIGDIVREGLYILQTPQAFLTSVILQAHALDDEQEYTCDASLLKARRNIVSRVVLGDRMNLKLTTPEDRTMLERIL